jgi:glycosyltransferase involved in cell wall biosynthesis
MSAQKLISIVVPVYNELPNIARLHEALATTLSKVDYDYELVFVDDGSTDDSLIKLQQLATTDARVQIIELSRNFGKEIATTAGLAAAQGEAAIILDADLQHPVKLIPQFIAKWEKGAEVVIGVRRAEANKSMARRFRSWLFYRMLNSVAETKVIPNASDFRLLDRVVIDEFNRFTERNRITRGLIDWLGFRRDYLYFQAEKRNAGTASYSTAKLIRLAVNSFVSLSLVPLKVAGWMGIVITLLSGLTGLFIVVEKYALGDPYSFHFSSPAILAIMILFLVGIVLSSLGLMSLYIATIHSEVVNRPLYVVRRSKKSKVI